MKTNKLLNLLQLIIGSILVVSSATTYAADTKATQATPRPGLPYLRDNSMVMGATSCIAKFNTDKCLDPLYANECLVASQSKTEEEYGRIENEGQLNSELDINGSIGLNVSSLDANVIGRFKKNKDKNKKTLTIVYYYKTGYRVALKDAGLTNPETFVLSRYTSGYNALAGITNLAGKSKEEKKSIEDNKKLFLQQCGDQYISEADAEILILAEIDLTLVDSTDVDDISGKLDVAVGKSKKAEDSKEEANDQATENAEAGGEKKAAGTGFGADLEGAVKYLATEKTKISSVAIRFQQKGGDIGALAKYTAKKDEHGRTYLQLCNFDTPEGVHACDMVIAGVKEYTANTTSIKRQLLKTNPEDPSKIEFRMENVWWSNPLAQSYPDLPFHKLGDDTVSSMSKTIDIKNDMLSLQTEIEDKYSKLSEALLEKSGTSAGKQYFPSDMRSLLERLDKKLGSMISDINPNNSNYSACFKTLPDEASCKTALQVATTKFAEFKNSEDMQVYEELQPVYQYKISNLPLLTYSNGVYEGTPVLNTTTCTAIKTETSEFEEDNTYRLYCPDRLPYSPGEIGLGVVNGNLVVTSFKLNNSCTSIPSTTPNKAPDEQCFTLNYAEDLAKTKSAGAQVLRFMPDKNKSIITSNMARSKLNKHIFGGVESVMQEEPAAITITNNYRAPKVSKPVTTSGG